MRQTKLASSLVNFQAHYKIVLTSLLLNIYACVLGAVPDLPKAVHRSRLRAAGQLHLNERRRRAPVQRRAMQSVLSRATAENGDGEMSRVQREPLCDLRRRAFRQGTPPSVAGRQTVRRTSAQSGNVLLSVQVEVVTCSSGHGKAAKARLPRVALYINIPTFFNHSNIGVLYGTV